MSSSLSPLSQRRELVERLDSEPLLDYLRRNGALKESDLLEVQKYDNPVKRNLHLLKCIENEGRFAQCLFVNALRQSGQHQLANLLDDTTRIKTLTGSGYLSKKRHKGQINITIQVRAIKYPLNALPTLPKGIPRQGGVSAREWVSSEDIQQRLSALLEPPHPPSSRISSIQQLQLLEPPDGPKKSHGCCLCVCFSRLFKNKKNPAARDKGAVYKASNGSGIVGSPAADGSGGRHVMGGPAGVSGSGDTLPGHFVTHTSTHISTTPSGLPVSTSAHSRESVEQLQALLELMNNTSNELYQLLRQDEFAGLVAQMTKYFEQQRGVLLLDTQGVSDGLVLAVICTKVAQVQTLRRELVSGHLLKDMEGLIVTQQVLDTLDILGLKLKVVIDTEDLDVAEHELT